MFQRSTFLLAFTALGSFTGCQTILGFNDTRIDDSANDAGMSDADTSDPGFSLAVLTPNVTLPLDGMNYIDVQVQRNGGFAGDVTVSLSTVPNGVTAMEVVIPGGETRGELVIGAASPLAIGDMLSLSLEATADALPSSTVDIPDALVTGRPGTLDSTFGIGASGLAAVSYGADDSGGFFGLEIIGNNIMAAGWGVGGLGGSRMSMIRLLPSGEVDASFNGGAMVRTGFAGSTADYAMAFAVGHQVDGRLIGIGWRERAGSEPGDIAVVRYGVDGSNGGVDFGNMGQNLVDLGGVEEVHDGVVLSSSRILVVGQRDDDFMIARLDTTGFLDTSFAGGQGYIAFGALQTSSARGLALDNQERIVVAGFGSDGAQSDFVLVRFTPDGQLDDTFSINQGGSPANERAIAVGVLPGGKIVTVGDSDANGNLDFEVRRFLPDGTPDTSFGRMGVATLPITPDNDRAVDMAILPDGRILVIGNTISGPTRGPILARYTRDGELDPFFGTGGVLPLYVGDSDLVHTVEVHPDNKVIIGGGNNGGTPGPGTFGVVVRMWM